MSGARSASPIPWPGPRASCARGPARASSFPGVLDALENQRVWTRRCAGILEARGRELLSQHGFQKRLLEPCWWVRCGSEGEIQN
eukprot:8101659-Pyramimonas_sp.AAC.1